MAKITRKKIFQQLKADLIGKDSHRGVTLTYSWFANQFGHFSLGFIPTLLLYTFLLKDGRDARPEFVAPIAISLGWLVFELYNFLGPLLKKKKSVSSRMYVPGKLDYNFKPAWANIAFDTFTDLCFFWIGAFTASVFIEPTTEAKVILLICLLVVIYPTYYWFITKMYLQNAFYPVQYRLSQWDFGISKKDKETVLTFLNKEDLGNHLFVCGGKGRGKTSLSIGLATEYSLKHKSSIYTTATKLYSFFSEKEPKFKDENLAWTWRDSSFMIIDDINPGPPVDEIISANKFMNYLDCNEKQSAVNRHIIKNKNVVWVLGNETSPDVDTIADWKKMLQKMQIPVEKIFEITV